MWLPWGKNGLCGQRTGLSTPDKRNKKDGHPPQARFFPPPPVAASFGRA
jgi:hypothetical protein